MDKKTLQNVVLLNVMNYGNAIVDSALFQMKNGDFNEDTFRGWIMDIEHQLDLLNEEEEESNDQHDSMLYRDCVNCVLNGNYCRHENSREDIK